MIFPTADTEYLYVEGDSFQDCRVYGKETDLFQAMDFRDSNMPQMYSENIENEFQNCYVKSERVSKV